MRKLMAAAALAAMLPAAGQAASLGLDTEDFPALLDTVEVSWFADFAEFSIIGSFNAQVVDEGGTVASGLFTSIVGEVGPGGVVGGSGGALAVTDFGALSATGTLLDFGWVIGAGTDTLEFLFSIDGLGIEALATITGEFGDDPFFDGTDDIFVPDAALRIAQVAAVPAPIPLPAGGVLLLTALGALALRRRS